MKQILSFDPGGTTGYCFMLYTDDQFPMMIDSGQIPDGHKGFIKWWRSYGIELAVGSTIVCESFTLREGVPGVNLEPCYVMGVLEGMLKNKQVVYQKPTYKAYCDNDALKRLGFYLRGQQHARDAVRHAIAYLRLKEKHIPTYRIGWPDDDSLEDRNICECCAERYKDEIPKPCGLGCKPCGSCTQGKPIKYAK